MSVLLAELGDLLGGESAGFSGVHTGPGATALTRMPRSTRLLASALVKAWMAPLVAE
jgi:hypothetical protein